MRKTLAIVGAVTAVGVSSIAGAHMASAHNNMSASSDIATKIAQRFNLSEAEVQKVFDESHKERRAQFEQKMADRLAQAVKDGKITQAQADMIKAKHAEMKTFEESLEGKTREERREAMKAKFEETEQWVKDNNLPREFALGPIHVKVAAPAEGELPEARIDHFEKYGEERAH